MAYYAVIVMVLVNRNYQKVLLFLSLALNKSPDQTYRSVVEVGNHWSSILYTIGNFSYTGSAKFCKGCLGGRSN